MRAGLPPPLFVLQVMEASKTPMREEERHAPARARGAKDSGGFTGPSTSRGEWELIPKKTNKVVTFLCRRTLGQAMCQKARRLALADEWMRISASYHVANV